MNKRKFLKLTFKVISFVSLVLTPANAVLKIKNYSFKKIYKKNQNKIWILKSDDI